MYLKHLTLRNFRNYRGLELELPPGLVVLYGDNGQGKSNLLEAVSLLALTKSPRAESEREIICFQSLEELPYTRVAGTARRRSGDETAVVIDLALPPPGTVPLSDPSATHLQKSVRVDGIPRRASDAVGTIPAVSFAAEDIGLVTGPPAARRRFLDILASQIDRHYLRALQVYQRVLTQRNHLLRRLQEGSAKPQELAFWDGELCAQGSRIIQWRHDLVAALAPLAAQAYEELAQGGEALEMRYLPSVEAESQELTHRFQERLAAMRAREVPLGQTLVGPHRDDLKLLLDARDVGVYGSRGQARSVALALRLAEAQHLAQRLGEEPILLLDDALSELDAPRRARVLKRAHRVQQTLLTTTDPERYPESARQAAAFFRVHGGTVTPGEPVDALSRSSE
jgi:DNA replication and repair protein RecF